MIDERCKFIEYELNNNYNQNKLAIHEYKKPKFHISVQEFYEYCESEPYIDLDN